MRVAFANAKATHIFFLQKCNTYAIFNDLNFNDTLTSNIVSFEQLGPELKITGNMYITSAVSLQQPSLRRHKTGTLGNMKSGCCGEVTVV